MRWRNTFERTSKVSSVLGNRDHRGRSSVTYDVKPSVSFPSITFRTIELAIASASRGSFRRACCNAASASGRRPRCNSATA